MNLRGMLNSVRFRVTAGEAVLALGVALVGYVATSAIGWVGTGAVSNAEATATIAGAAERYLGAIGNLDRIATGIVERGGFGGASELEQAIADVDRISSELWRTEGLPVRNRLELQHLTMAGARVSSWFAYSTELARLGRGFDAESAHENARVLRADLATETLRFHSSVARTALDETANRVESGSRSGIVSWILVALFLASGTALITLGIEAFRSPVNRLSAYAGRIARGDLRPMPLGTFPDELTDLSDGVQRVGLQLRTLVARSSELSEAAADLGDVVLERTQGLRGRAIDLRENLDRLSKRSAEQENRGNQGLSVAERQVQSGNEFGESLDALRDRTESMRRSLARSRGAVLEAVVSVRRMKQLLDAGSDRVGNLKDLARTVTEIDQAITRIASQAQVLALNAAIEAARGGKFGDEMKVIADEVAELANISAESAEQSEEVTSKLRDGLQEAATTFEEGRNRFRAARGVADEAEEALDELGKQASTLETQSESALKSARVQVSASTDTVTILRDMARVATDQSGQAHDAREQSREQESSLDAVIDGLNELGRSTIQLREILQTFRL